MDDFSYFTYTGVYTYPAPGEMWSVTQDGVVSVSAIASPAGVPPVGTVPAAGLTALAPAAAEATTSIDAYSTDKGKITRDVSVVAVDSKGASTVLHLRFLFGCGQVPN